MSDKPRPPLYGHNRKLHTLEPHYCAHVSAMTTEALRGKSDIAAELAWRDMEIAKRDQALDAANKIIGEAADEAKRLQDKIEALETSLEYESQIPTSETINGNVRGFAAYILHGDEKHRAWLIAAAEAFIADEELPPKPEAP
jgi:hypothetical protein